MISQVNQSRPMIDAEAALLDRLRHGDQEAFEQLVCSCAGPLHATAMRLLRHQDDAAEAVQDALLLAFRSVDRFRGEARLLTWLKRIVINAALMKMRKRRHHECSFEDLMPRFLPDGHRIEPPQREPPPDDDAERCAALRRLIDELPDAYRTVLLLRDVEGLDTAQTARAVGTTPGAVKVRLHRARLALRELITGERAA